MPPAPPPWKTVVAALAGPSAAEAPRAGAERAGAERAGAEMGLLFELRELIPRSKSRWNGPSAKTATATSARREVRLAVRPVIRSGTGNWVRANVTWSTIGYQVNRLELRVEQLRWFTQFAALHRATREAYSGQEPDWIYLDDYHSPLLWPLLGQAADLGIRFVSGKREQDVMLGERGAVSLDVTAAGTRTTGNTALLVTATLAIDGVRHPVDTAGAVGDHGVYAWALGPPRFALAPTPLSTEERGLLGTAAEVTVPQGEAEEFLRDYYPRLSRSIEVTSSDDSVLLPEPAPPELVLTATFAKKQTLGLRWEVPHDADPALAREVRQLVGTLVASDLEGIDAAEFAATVLPGLEGMPGVRVQIVGERPDYHELTERPKLVVKTVATHRRDWFDLGLNVSIEGRIVPFGRIFTALSKGQTKLLLIDNSYLSLNQPVFDELRELIEEAGELAEWETSIPISRYQASLWADFEDLADETEQAQAWRDAVGGLVATEGVTHTPPPDGLRATLRPYQQQGFDWLAFLWRHGLGGILADDMGLGKTLQTLALIGHAVASGEGRPFLVVAPTSVVSNWLAEAARFTDLRVAGITATQAKSRRPLADEVAGADVVVTSYALFRLDFAAYQAQEWAGLILDEAQFVKNHASKAHERAVELRAPFKLALTGTPMENSLLDLWSLFAIVAPGLFPSLRQFGEAYVRPIASGANPLLLTRLRRRIRPLMMRRTKEVVAKELPAKQEQVLRVDLAPRHRKLYDTFLQKERQKLLGLIDDLDRNRFIVFRSLTLLRMLSLDASLVDAAYDDVPSSKLDALFEQLDDVIAEGHRALVFSQFTSFLGKATARLDAAGIPYEYLDGSTLRRAEVIERFKTGDAPVFLISLKAGGFGLNLTEADYVFLLDPWWNPATEAQAVDRTHRIGQTRRVNVYRMVATGTIEEKVMALKEQKARLFEAVMDDDTVSGEALTADDIRRLLE